MLDIETRNRIDTARDIMVGKVPIPSSQVEQITIALIYKFMDDMDARSEELGGEREFFAGKYAKYSWKKLMSPALGGHDVLNLYSEAIQAMNQNPNIPQLFRDIFKNAFLPYRDPETLKSFLKTIDGFEYDHSERLGDAFEYLLSVLGSQGDAGQFRTPRHIIDFMVEAVAPKKDEKILDPACGTSGFLISSYKYILKHNSSNYKEGESKAAFELKDTALDELATGNTDNYRGDLLTPDERKRLADNIVGYDISPDMVRLSLVNLYLHGFPNPRIYEYDTLSSEDNWNEFADVIMANPPFMSPKGGIKPHKRFSIQAKRSEILFVDYIVEHLTPNGRGAVIVPEGIIFQSGTAYKHLRKMLVEGYLYGVVSLPAGVFNPYSGVKTSILLFDKALNKKTDKILFVKIENDGFDLGAQRRPNGKNDLPEALKHIKDFIACVDEEKEFETDEIKNVNTVEKEKIGGNDEWSLSGERYLKVAKENTKYDMVELGREDLFRIESGGTPSSQIDEYWDGDIVWLTLVDLPQADYISHINSSVRKITVEGLKNSSAKLIPADSVIVSTRATIGRVGVNHVELATNQGFKNIIIRDKKKALPLFVAYMIKNLEPTMNTLASGGTFKELSKSKFSELCIPLPPLEVQKEIVEEIEGYQKIIDGARQVVDNYKPHLDIDPDWEMVELEKAAIVLSGFAFKSEDFSENNLVKCVKITNVGVREFVESENENLPAEYLKRYENFIVKEGDLVISLTRSIISSGLKIAVVPESYDNTLLNQRVGLVKGKSKISFTKYIYYYLCSPRVYYYVENKSRSLMQPNLSIVDLKKMLIPLPSISVQKAIINEIEKTERIIDSNKKLISIFEQKIKNRIAKVWGE